MSFDELCLDEAIQKSIKECGYTQPTPIQEKAIPILLEGNDFLGGAQTGTGKTASFTLPLLHLLKNPTKPRVVRALIIAPTRELAIQVQENIRTYSKYLPVRTAVTVGGVSIRSEKMKLQKGVDILVATPGRLLDHVKQKHVDLSSVERFVVDEVDCLLDMGFIHDLRKIESHLPKERQTILFSATLSKPIHELAKAFLTNPSIVEIAKRNAVSTSIKQIMHPVDRKQKSALLLHLLQENSWEKTLIFTRTKRTADALTKELKEENIKAAAIHGDKKQAVRKKTLLRFREGKTKVLVATDIAARGLDIAELSHVVNYELPLVTSDYVHRIGRTGRAGALGEAISLVCHDETRLLKGIEKLIGEEIEEKAIPGYAATKKPSRAKKPFRKKSRPFKKGKRFSKR